MAKINLRTIKMCDLRRPF